MPSKKPLWLTLAPGLFLLFWAAGYPMAKLALEDSGPLSLLSIRYALIIIVLYPVFLVLRPPVPQTRRGWFDLCLVGFLIQVLYFGLSYLAFNQGVPVGTVALILSMQPVIVALAAPFTVGERIGLLRWIGFAMGLLGTALVILSNSKVGLFSPLGLALCLAALFGMSAAALYEKRFGVTNHPVTANLVQYSVGFAGTFPLVILFEGMHVDWTPRFAMVISYLVICNSLIALSLLLAMLRAGEAARVSALLFLVPPLAALIAWLLIGEILRPQAWAGLFVATVGVALATRSGKSRATPPLQTKGEA